MNDQQIYIFGMVAKGLIEALGMMSDNLQRLQHGETIAYDSKAFEEVIKDNGIYHNAIIGYLKE